MLICRCAWHRRYHGYPLVSKVVSWRGWNVRFTDGICASCLERFRTEHRRFLSRASEQVPAPLEAASPGDGSATPPPAATSAAAASARRS
jgi:hypothetical protein